MAFGCSTTTIQPVDSTGSATGRRRPRWWSRRNGRIRICFKVVGKERESILIQDLAGRLVSELDRRQAAANSFNQHGHAQISKDSSVRRAHRADNVSGEALIRKAWVNWRNVGLRRRIRLVAPQRGPVVFAQHVGIWRNRRGQPTVGRSHEHAVDAWVRIEGRSEPLLRVRLPGRCGQKFRNVGQGLVILNDPAGAREVVPNEVGNQFHKGLPIAQDP